MVASQAVGRLDVPDAPAVRHNMTPRTIDGWVRYYRTSDALGVKRLLAYAAIYLVWGGGFLAIRVIVLSIPPFASAATRFLIAGALLILPNLLQSRPLPSLRDVLAAAFVGLLMFGGEYGCLFWAERYVSSGLTAVLTATIPLWILVANVLFLRDQLPSVRSATGFLLGFFGVVLLLRERTTFHAGAILPSAVVLVGAVCWAAGTLLCGHLSMRIRPSLTAGIAMVSGAIFLLCCSLIAHESITRVPMEILHDPNVFAAMLYLILGASIGGFLSYIWVLEREATLNVARYAYINPLVAIAVGRLFVREHFSSSELLGAFFIVLGVMLTLLKDTNEANNVTSHSYHKKGIHLTAD